MTETNKTSRLVDQCQSEVISLLAQVSEDERQAWATHPCAKALVTSLNGLIIQESLVDGLNRDSIDATALEAARRSGFVQALLLTLSEIEAYSND